MSKRRQWRLRGRRKDPRWHWVLTNVIYRTDTSGVGTWGIMEPERLEYSLVKKAWRGNETT